MIRRITCIILFFLPIVVLGQNTDPGSNAVRDSLASRKDSTRYADSIRLAKKAADSIHYVDTTVYHWSYTATGTINNTNTLNSYLLSNGASVSAVRKRSTVSMNTGWVYGAQGRTLTNNDFNVSADLSMYKTLRHFYYWGLINYSTSLSLQINNLLQSGAGVGYNVLDKKKAVVILSDGILYENGDLYHILYGGPNGNAPVRDKYQVLRNSFRLKYNFVINDRITLGGTQLIQHSLGSVHNYILNLNANGSVRVYKWLNLTAAVAFNKFTRTRSENTLVTFGFTITH